MNLVVTDTGPLLHLQQVGVADLLSHLGNIKVTLTVGNELGRHAPAFKANGTPPWLTVCRPSASAVLQANQWVTAQMLHAGEAEALAFAQESHADIFLTDDTAARTLGESLGIHVRAPRSRFARRGLVRRRFPSSGSCRLLTNNHRLGTAFDAVDVSEG